jgi:hypothetical protein
MGRHFANHLRCPQIGPRGKNHSYAMPHSLTVIPIVLNFQAPVAQSTPFAWNVHDVHNVHRTKSEFSRGDLAAL